MSPAQPKPPKKSPSPIAETILTRTNKVGQIVTRTQSSVDQVLDLLTMEPPEGVEDPIQQLQDTLDNILGRLSSLEDLTARLLQQVELLSKKRFG